LAICHPCFASFLLKKRCTGSSNSPCIKIGLVIAQPMPYSSALELVAPNVKDVCVYMCATVGTAHENAHGNVWSDGAIRVERWKNGRAELSSEFSVIRIHNPNS
jgi:hypothetical protein